MVNGIADTLERLARTFTVRDVMIDAEEMACGDDLPSALRLLEVHEGYDIIPIRRNGELVEYLRRGQRSLQLMQVDDLISDSTPILDLAGLLSQTGFRFILSGQRVAGYVNFSDLNNQVVKIPYFVLVEAVESRIVSRIEGRITEADLMTALPARATRIMNKMRRLSENRTDRGYAHCLYFGEMLTLACYYKVLELSNDHIERLTEVRNRIDHADRSLVECQKDAALLVEAQVTCMAILEQLVSDEGEKR